MKSIFLNLTIGFSLAACATISAPGTQAQSQGANLPGCGVVGTYPGTSWPAPALPDGWNAGALEQAHALFESSEAHAVMIVHRGRLVASWGSVEEPLTIQSQRKPVLGAVIGQLVESGVLDLDATLADMDIQDSDAMLSEEERQATLRDLLQSRSGILHDANYEVGGWRRMRLELRESGSWERGLWLYNNWDFNVLGTILRNATGEDLGNLVNDYLAEPVNMQDFDPALTSYSGRDSLAQQHFGYGSDHDAYMFEISTRDMARFGLLYLGCGEWSGRQIVSRDWVEESLTGIDTHRGLSDQAVTGFDRYGYLWWIENGGAEPRFPSLAFAQPFYGASGNRGHFTLILPRYDLVIAHQPRTVGGIGDAAQMDRARNGSPNVSEEEFASLVRYILAAHPDAQ